MRGIFSRPRLRSATVVRSSAPLCMFAAVAIFLATISGCASISADKTPVTAKISVVPAVINFNSVVVGQKNSQTVRITNSSATSIGLQRLRTSGSGFTLSSLATPLLLAPGKDANVHVVYAPSSTAAAQGSLFISSPDLPEPLSVPLSGSGEKAAAALAASPANINFGTRAVKSSSSQSVTLKNTGNMPFSINSVTLTGSAFSISGITAGVSLSSGQTLNFQVWFRPTTSGSSSTTVTLASAALSAPVKITLAGSANTSASTSGPGSPRHSVTLDWNPSSDTVVGYHIYRSTSSSGPFSRISGSLVSSLNYLDASVQAGAEYFYVVTAVEASGAESAFSNVASGAIPSP